MHEKRVYDSILEYSNNQKMNLPGYINSTIWIKNKRY